MPNDNWVSWLNLTNIALGVVVILAVLVVAYAVIWELVSRHKKPAIAANLDEELDALLRYGRSVPGLGVTMADGGEPMKSLRDDPAGKKRS